MTWKRRRPFRPGDRVASSTRGPGRLITQNSVPGTVTRVEKRRAYVRWDGFTAEFGGPFGHLTGWSVRREPNKVRVRIRRRA